MNWPPWHPMMVHFPLALVLTAASLLFASRLIRPDTLAATLATVGTWNLCLGAAGVVFAFATGFAATLDLELSAQARSGLAVHIKWAACASFSVLILAVWRSAAARQEARPSTLFLIVLGLASVAMLVTAYRGGLNVYHFGIGVAR